MRQAGYFAMSMNAAGIADAFRTAQASHEEGTARLEELTRTHDGWECVVAQIAEAGALMERLRAQHGATATWGGDLPYLYDVWDAIAEALWRKLGQTTLEESVEAAIERAFDVGAGSR